MSPSNSVVFEYGHYKLYALSDDEDILKVLKFGFSKALGHKQLKTVVQDNIVDKLSDFSYRDCNDIEVYCVEYKGELVGMSLLQWGYPWYNSDSLIVEDIYTVGSKGTSAIIGMYLKDLVDSNGASCAISGSYNSSSEPVLTNTYVKRLGFNTYPSFYYIKK